jgi:hypothetical protein
MKTKDLNNPWFHLDSFGTILKGYLDGYLISTSVIQ